MHRFYQEQEQINGGRMDRFVAVSDVGALPMGYFDGGSLLLYSLASEYTLADRFFHAAFGGGFLNHMWLICACTPRYDDAPRSLVAQLDEDGRMIRRRCGDVRRIRRQYDPISIHTARSQDHGCCASYCRCRRCPPLVVF